MNQVSMPALAVPETRVPRRHSLLLRGFVALMVAHWLEHGVQAYQVYALGYDRHHAGGILGQIFPWLMHSEWLHFTYAILTFAGLLMLRPVFAGRALRWWNIALLIQAFHLLEHTLLFAQAQGGFRLFGASEPSSILQVFFPRIELHLFYNSVVTVPIVVAMFLHMRSGTQQRTSAARAA